TQYTAKTFIIATGAKLKTGDITGLDTVNYLTPETALRVSRLPKCALIIGGGSTGCEIANYYAALGAKVILMERAPRILPREDKEVSLALTEYFTNELGIMVIPDARVVALEQDSLSKRVIFSADGKEKLVRIDCVVLATGSEPNLDLGLENAGVKYKRSGILVNKFFETSTKNIYAIGDCLNRANSSTELAEYEALLLVSNLLKKTKAVANYRGFIRQTNTYPAVAVVGQNERELLAARQKHHQAIVYLKDLPCAKIENLETGFVKLYADKDGRLLGATIVAPNAALLAEELSLVLRHRLNLSTIASTPHLSLGLNNAIKLAARKLSK
ncbi:MAG: FAD-dependent oxidoreductase, partial [Bacteroidales bacterium]|nr:FAD-dependent oxidoreductase [Bacteroidales bacterium]